MKTLTIHIFVAAVALGLSATTSMAATEMSSLNQIDKGTATATAAISPAPFHALSGLDEQALANQEMTDQELKAVEGGMTLVEAFLNGFELGRSTPLWGSNGNVIMGSCVSCQGM
jgi:hypothetical protein